MTPLQPGAVWHCKGGPLYATCPVCNATTHFGSLFTCAWCEGQTKLCCAHYLRSPWDDARIDRVCRDCVDPDL